MSEELEVGPGLALSIGHAVHEVKGCQYCLGCGRSTKAKAQRLFWKNQACVPSDRYKAYMEKGHRVLFNGN